jgi:hypothetical protein
MLLPSFAFVKVLPGFVRFVFFRGHSDSCEIRYWELKDLIRDFQACNLRRLK